MARNTISPRSKPQTVGNAHPTSATIPFLPLRASVPPCLRAFFVRLYLNRSPRRHLRHPHPHPPLHRRQPRLDPFFPPQPHPHSPPSSQRNARRTPSRRTESICQPVVFPDHRDGRPAECLRT